MSHLPWLLVHGTAVALAALAVAMLAGAGVGIAWPAIAATVRAWLVRRRLSERTPPGRFEDGRHVVVEGVIAADGGVASFDLRQQVALATLFRAHAARPKEAMIARAAEGAVVVVEGVRVEVTGAPVVLLGSCETRRTSFHRATARARETAVDADPDRAFTLESTGASVVAASVVSGDRVVALGTLRRAASEGSRAGYRRASAAWTLELDRSGKTGVFFLGRPTIELRAPRGALAGAIVGAFAFAASFLTTGEIATAIARSSIQELRVSGPKPLAAIDALALASIDPLRRDALLADLSGVLHDARHHDPRLTEELVDLDELRGDPSARARTLLAHGQLARAAQIGAHANDPALRRMAADAFDAIGEEEAASDAILGATPMPLADAIVHLLAGHPDRAAIALRAYEVEPSDADRPSTRCLTEAVEYMASGDAQRLASLKAMNLGASSRMCALLHADLAGEEAGRRVDADRVVRQDDRHFRVAHALERLFAREAGQRAQDTKQLVYPEWLAFGRAEQHLVAFLPALLESDDTLVRDDRNAAVEAVVVASAIGDHRRASTLLERLRATYATRAPSDFERYEDEPFMPRMLDVIARRARAEDPLPNEHGIWVAQDLEAWTRGARDGGVLARLLDEEPREADQLYVVARAVRANRAELSDWLRYGHVEPRAVTHVGRLAELEDLRLAAIALGDEARASELDAIETRLRSALIRRSTIAVVSVLESMRSEDARSPRSALY